MSSEAVILYCRCTYGQVVPGDVKDEVLRRLCEAGRPFRAVADLCERAARRDAALRALPACRVVKVAACHARAVRSLMEASGAGTRPEDIRAWNMRGLPAGQVVDGLLAEASSLSCCCSPGDDTADEAPAERPFLRIALYEDDGAEVLSADRRFGLVRALLDAGYGVDACGAGGGERPLLILGEFREGCPTGSDPSEVAFLDVAGLAGDALVAAVADAAGRMNATPVGQWQPWFPAIDYDRCTGCRQCHNFCIFGVYDVRDGRVVVAHPDKCKLNCPACARICPAAAIIFPKYADAPINGAEIRPEDLQDQKMQTNIKDKLQGDVYGVLRGRGVSAGDEAALAEALEKRRQCACGSGGPGDAPKVLLDLGAFVKTPADNRAPADDGTGGGSCGCSGESNCE